MATSSSSIIHFIKSPAHTGIIKNEMADAAAKELLNTAAIINVPILYTDLKKHIYLRLKHDYNET